MVQIEINKIVDLKRVLTMLSKIKSDIIISISSKGVHFQESNSRFTIMINMFIDKTFFKKYVVKENVNYKIDIEYLLTFVNIVDNNSVLKVLIFDKNIIFQEYRQNIVSRFYQVKKVIVLDEKIKNVKLNKLVFQKKLRINSKDLFTSVNNIKKFTDVIRFRSFSQSFRINAVNRFVNFEECIIVERVDTSVYSVSSKYNIKHILGILRLYKIFQTLTFSFGNNMPLKISLISSNIVIDYYVCDMGEDFL